MRIGIIQSSFIPWRGYFDFIASVDMFIFYDDVQYSKGSWRNRNKIKCRDGLCWLTVPVRGRSLKQLIIETDLDETKDWRTRHLTFWNREYANAPFLADALELLGDMGRGKDKTISQLNIGLTRRICEYLGIQTKMIMSSELNVEGYRTERLINYVKAVGGATYLTGPSAEGYLENELFAQNRIRLEYKTYDYAPYPQQYGEFEGAVTVLDLIANCGPNSKGLIRSLTPDRVVVP
jgi:hypothetical protein